MSDANWEALEDSRGPSPLMTCGIIMNYIGRSKPSGGRFSASGQPLSATRSSNGGSSSGSLLMLLHLYVLVYVVHRLVPI